MNYKFVSWVTTDYWEGALIQHGDVQYLTSGVHVWEVTPERNYKTVASISDQSKFMKFWNEHLRHSTIEGVPNA